MLDFTKAITAIEHAKNILILPSSPVDGDSLGSALALYDVLKNMDKSATVVLTSDIPDIYKFLPNISHIHSSAEMYSDFMITLHLKDQELEDIRHEIVDDHVNIIVTPSQGRFTPEQVSFPEPKKHYDLIITVDCADLTQLGEFYKQHFQIFSEVPSINIDHHISNKNYASLNLVDPGYCSTTHILYDLLLELSAEINSDVATLLLAGIITDTGSFQNTNTTPEAFDVAAELIDLGGRQQEIIQHIYKTKQLNSLKLWGKILSKIQIDNEYQLMWTSLTNIDLKETDTTNQDKGEIMDELLSNAEDARIVILLEERPGQVLHGSIRVNNDEINAVTIAENFGGGGHQRAAGFNIQGATVESHESKVLKFIRQYLDSLAPANEPEAIETDNKETVGIATAIEEDFELKPVAVPAPPVDAPEIAAIPQEESTTIQPEPAADPIQNIEDEFSDMPPAPAELATEPLQEPAPTPDPIAYAAPEPVAEPIQESQVTPSVSELDAEFDAMPSAPATQQVSPEPTQAPISQPEPAQEPISQPEVAPAPILESEPVSQPTAPIAPQEMQAAESPVSQDMSEFDQGLTEDSQMESESEPDYSDADLDAELAPNASEFGGDESLDTDDEFNDQDEFDEQDEFTESESEELELEDQIEDDILENIEQQNNPNQPAENMDTNPLATQEVENQETEDRIKDLSQKFFTEESQASEQAQGEQSSEQNFSEIPAFGENLDMTQLPTEQAEDDGMQFPPNPFGNPTEPGQMPAPDVPDDL